MKNVLTLRSCLVCAGWLALGSACTADDAASVVARNDAATIDASANIDAATDASGAAGGTIAPGTELYGYFRFGLFPATEATGLKPASPAYTKVEARISDGPQLIELEHKWNVDMQEGDCRLLARNHPFCDPTCTGLAECVDDGVCAEAPAKLDAGRVRVSGLGPEYDLKFINGNYNQPPAVKLAYPPCAEGDTVHLEIDGGGSGGFDLDAACVEPIEFPGPVAMERGQPLHLSWTAPGMLDLARIEAEIDISSHGGANGLIRCDAPDTGSLDIAAPLIDGLLDLGVAGYPSIVVKRIVQTVGPTEHSKKVELTLYSSHEIPVTVPGVTSCGSTAECPMGETCTDYRCQ
jgi:hypothetical protein